MDCLSGFAKRRNKVQDLDGHLQNSDGKWDNVFNAIKQEHKSYSLYTNLYLVN